MPAAYAHFQFGQECLKCLDGEDYRIVKKHKNLYNYGVQGPDLLFYSFFRGGGKVFKKGMGMHTIPGKEIFSDVKTTMLAGQANNEEFLAYVLGFLSHYTLDSSCHSYIERKKEVSDISHNLIESQYDAHLMRRNGVDRPSIYPRAYLMEPDKIDARIISMFYKLPAKTIYKCMKGQRTALNLFSIESPWKRKILTDILRKYKPSVHYNDLLCDDEELDGAKDSNLRLDKIRKIALSCYQDLYKNFKLYLSKGLDLVPYFDNCMDKWPNYREIPVLSLAEEMECKPEGDLYEAEFYEQA